jgi:hypothetical protein
MRLVLEREDSLSRSEINNQIEEIPFCRCCAEELFNSWRGWPIRDKIPVPPVMDGGVCPKCGGTEVIVSSNIAWLNHHGPSNTGLPDYWTLTISTRTGFMQDFLSRWGLPYFKWQICPRCEELAILSLFVPDMKQQCLTCGFVTVEEGTRRHGTENGWRA